jgi:hypothetical protein
VILEIAGPVAWDGAEVGWDQQSAAISQFRQVFAINDRRIGQ